MKKRAYLGLGSNLGDRRGHLERALDLIRAAGIEVRRVSSIYETEPVDCRAPAWFLNCVVEAETELMPMQLLQRLKKIERQLGRRREVPRGPRTIDIDILLYGNCVVETAALTIPHPRLAERRFVLEPLRELAPDRRHPVTRRTVAEMLAAVSDRSQVRKIDSLDH
jgi:2-amino-4-hydroxy-6-hydroxymethyldihydropteridine diphosphokinase